MINVVLYQPEIPQNTGNIIRTCFATNAKLHIILPIAFDLHPKWFKRYGAGKMLSDIPHEIHASYEDFYNKYGKEKIFYITRYGQINYSSIDFKGETEKNENIFLMFGRESTGIPKEILKDNFDNCLRVPMTPESRSLNLANSVMLLVYEVHRQTGFIGLSNFEVQKGKDWLKN